ncbi:hypothetical protein DR72_391 [Klebsiella aerogenes]|nr:hypothetical protein DR72_391 [Klebsiella aerogenes]KLE49904.1 hypothetical protein YA13_01750 [Klebsiella aerogenes]KTH36409.1 hypothetical protein ASV26_04115 [Klebsiella aerogenes]KZR51882.1 hypothetical protein A3N69_05505 [Klebsiella aerogenes]VEI09122.1 Uncharacterised protein [Klebsiella aerogenes]
MIKFVYLTFFKNYIRITNQKVIGLIFKYFKYDIMPSTKAVIVLGSNDFKFGLFNIQKPIAMTTIIKNN